MIPNCCHCHIRRSFTCTKCCRRKWEGSLFSTRANLWMESEAQRQLQSQQTAATVSKCKEMTDLLCVNMSRVRCDQINGTVQLASLLSIISVVGCVQALTANWSTYFCLRCRSRGSELNELPCSSHGQGVKTSPISTAIMTHGLTECCCKFTEKCSDVLEKSKCNLYGIY